MSTESTCISCGKITNKEDSYDGRCFLCSYTDDQGNVKPGYFNNKVEPIRNSVLKNILYSVVTFIGLATFLITIVACIITLGRAFGIIKG